MHPECDKDCVKDRVKDCKKCFFNISKVVLHILIAGLLVIFSVSMSFLSITFTKNFTITWLTTGFFVLIFFLQVAFIKTSLKGFFE